MQIPTGNSRADGDRASPEPGPTEHRLSSPGRVAVYSDHLAGVGGGEKYALAMIKAIASVASVDVYARNTKFLPNPDIAREFLGLQLGGWDISWKVTDEAHNFGDYDLFVNISHFVIPPPTGKTNLLVVFFPHMPISVRAPRYDAIATISDYSRKWVRLYWGALSHLVYPFSERRLTAPEQPKRKMILAVGRFFRAQDANNKNQHLMIQTFRKLVERGIHDWELVLAGSPASNQSDQYIKSLHALAQGLPVRFVFDPKYEALSHLYQQASLFWHAAGFDERGGTQVAASAAEHFGIVIVEAMAAGAVPVVPAIGGPVEIVEDGKSGCVCADLNEFSEKTLRLIQSPEVFERMSKAARLRASHFSEGRLAEGVRCLIRQLLRPGPLQRGISLARRGLDVGQAERLLLQETCRQPAALEAWVELGDLYYRSGRRDEAFVMWHRAYDAASDSFLKPALGTLCASERLRQERWTQRASDQIYDESYFAAESTTGVTGYLPGGAARASVHAQIFRQAFAPKKCLDFGCGKGELVQALRQQGVDCYGVDLSAYAMGAAPESVRPYLSRTEGMPLDFSDAGFDLVVAIDVLEHIPEETVPIVLKELRRVCRNVVFMTVEDTSGTPPHIFFRDPSHQTLRPLSWWEGAVRAAGFAIFAVEVPRPEFRGHQIMARIERLPESHCQ